jgi:hypothetical protein
VTTHGTPPQGRSFHVSDARLTTLLTEQQAAALLGVTVKTLQGWRYRGGGPAFVKLGRCVRYRAEDLQDFVTAAVRTSTSDPGSPSRRASRMRVEPLLEKTGRSLGTMKSTDPSVITKAR